MDFAMGSMRLAFLAVLVQRCTVMRGRDGLRGIWLAGMALACACQAACGATLTLPAVADTALFEGKPDADLGGSTLLSGTNQLFARGRALFRFDLTSLPAGAVVTAVEVSLYVTRRPDPDQHGGPVDSDFSLYRMFVSWGEGVGADATGSVAVPGAATWNERHFGGTAWASPGGQMGTDFSNTASATTLVSDVGSYVWGSSAELIDDVRAWVADPASNHGFILISQSESSLGSGRRFGSTEQPGGLIPPATLSVTYSLVPEPSVAGMAALGLWCILRRRRGVRLSR